MKDDKDTEEATGSNIASTKDMVSSEQRSPVFKPLEWKPLGYGDFVVDAPLFGKLRIEKYGDTFVSTFSVPGFGDTFAKGEFGTAEEAKQAAEREYERRMNEALSVKVDKQALIRAAFRCLRYGARFRKRDQDDGGPANIRRKHGRAVRAGA